jgi:hydrogenase expression/formation protein HypD
VKHLAEYRDVTAARRLAAGIRAAVTRPWAIMEVCGGQTHSIIRNGIDQVLPGEIELIHGPGCPVCVTPLETIDRALAIARTPGVILCSFGDMLRVPGSHGDLAAVKAEGGDVRVVYSPLDAVALARRHPDREVVFLAIGFETTAPATAMAAMVARRQRIGNFSMLVSHVLVPPALQALLQAPGCRIDAFLAAGHVCSVMGIEQYRPIAAAFRVPIVVTGFEPLDLLAGVGGAVAQLEAGRAVVENAYARAVSDAGNPAAQAVIAEVFETTDRAWRGIGLIPGSGWRLSERYRDLDAERRFDVACITARESTECRSGEVLQGMIKPSQCAAFGRECTPRSPLGAPMVSGEGACAAYYHAGRIAAVPAAAGQVGA